LFDVFSHRVISAPRGAIFSTHKDQSILMLIVFVSVNGRVGWLSDFEVYAALKADQIKAQAQPKFLQSKYAASMRDKVRSFRSCRIAMMTSNHLI